MHRSGKVWEAVRASMSIVDYLPPMHVDGDLLIDGGYINNVILASSSSTTSFVLLYSSHHAIIVLILLLINVFQLPVDIMRDEFAPNTIIGVDVENKTSPFRNIKNYGKL